ncbi:GNAT family N-acetyltransferase [Octadecabacter sp.]|nr:GNAT family N-acetyltransferase [Octadecabacter sp.]
MIQTKRLTLRAPRVDDLDAMFEVYSDPRAMKYWSTAPHADRSVTSKLLENRVAAWDAAPLNFQIELDDRYIGNAGNFMKDEIGFILHPDHWRNGYVSEAMAAIIPHLWQVTDHAQLTADADPNNAASIGLLTSLGFSETHRAKNTFFFNDQWYDSVYFALPRPS